MEKEKNEEKNKGIVSAAIDAFLNNPKYTRSTKIKILVGVAIGFLLLIIIPISFLFGSKSPEKFETQSPTSSTPNVEEKKKDEPQKNTIGGHIVSETAITDYCEDAGLIGKYLSLSDIAIIAMTEYNHQYNVIDGWYDQSGNSIVMTRWNGRDKKNGQRMVFDCWASGSSDDNIVLHWFSVSEDGLGTIDMVGSKDYPIYDANGNEKTE